VELDAEAVDLLVEEAILLHHVVDDLRDIAAADAGSLRLHREHSYVRDLLEQSARRTGPRDGSTWSPTRAHGVRRPSACARPWATSCPNALRHTPPDGRVTIRAEASASAWSSR
jgi:two-component system sensor histidine kinase BaeS